MTSITEHLREGGDNETGPGSSEAHKKQKGQNVMGEPLEGCQVRAQEGAFPGPVKQLDVQTLRLPSAVPAGAQPGLQQLVLGDLKQTQELGGSLIRRIDPPLAGRAKGLPGFLTTHTF